MGNIDKKLQRLKYWYIGLSALVVLLPMILTCEPISILSFKDTGPIGDTIGGIMSPFIAILVGYLTFEAFRMQYIANEMQKSAQEKQDAQISQEKLKSDRERFDNRFYIMLDTLRANSRNIRLGDNFEGKETFKMLVAELFATFYVVKKAYLSYRRNASANVSAYLGGLAGGKEDLLITRIAYGLFFYGDLYHVNANNEPEVEEIVNNMMPSITKNGTWEEHSYDFLLNHEITQGNIPHFPWDMLKGYNDQLGHYFRHLYQMVKFLALADSKIVPETDKNEYARIIRAELSDYEQALLFYNAASDPSFSWNNPINVEANNEYSQRGLLSRFRLIKNLPGNIMYRGIDPWSFYKDDDDWWKAHHKEFFGSDYVIMADDVY